MSFVLHGIVQSYIWYATYHHWQDYSMTLICRSDIEKSKWTQSTCWNASIPNCNFDIKPKPITIFLLQSTPQLLKGVNFTRSQSNPSYKYWVFRGPRPSYCQQRRSNFYFLNPFLFWYLFSICKSYLHHLPLGNLWIE